MAIKTKQSSKQVAPRRWEWAVWLDGEAEELDGVDHVVYYLHPTFRNPVRTITGRRSNFRLSASGWGTFTLGVEIHHKDKRVESLEHHLTFEESPAEEGQEPPSRVLLLSESEDSEEAQQISQHLRDEGVEVVPASALGGGTWSKELIDGIRSVDAVVSIGEAHRGSFRIEAKTAAKLGKQVLQIGTERADVESELFRSLSYADLKSAGKLDSRDVAKLILSYLKSKS